MRVLLFNPARRARLNKLSLFVRRVFLMCSHSHRGKTIDTLRKNGEIGSGHCPSPMGMLLLVERACELPAVPYRLRTDIPIQLVYIC